MTKRPRSAVAALLAAVISAATLSAQHEVEQYSWAFRNFKSDSDHFDTNVFDDCPEYINEFDWNDFRKTFIGIPPQKSNNLFEWLVFDKIYRTELANSGNCYGISLMSLLIHDKGGNMGFCGPTLQYSGDLDGSSCQWGSNAMNPDGSTAYGPTDLRLREAVEVMHGYQISYPSVLFYADLLNKNVTRDGMFAWQKAHELAPALVSITKDLSPGGGGHTMLAYATEVDANDPNLHYIYFYDPNYSWANPDFRPFYENRHNRITIRADDKSWTVTRDWQFDAMLGDVVPTTPPRIWSGSPGGGGNLVIIPLDLVAHKARSPGSDMGSIGNILQVLFTSGDDDLVQVTSGDGKRLFRPGTFEIDTNVDTGMLTVAPLYLSDGAGGGRRLNTSTYSFFDGSPGPFDIEIAPGPTGYSMTVGGSRGVVEVRAWGASSTDTVVVDGANTLAPSLTLLNRGGAESFDVSFTQFVRPGESSRVLHARNITLPPGAPLRLGLAQNRGGLEVKSPVADVELDPVFERRQGRDSIEVGAERLEVAAGESAFLAPGSWAELADAPLNLYSREIPAPELEELFNFISVPTLQDIGPDFDAARSIGESASGSLFYEADSESYAQEVGPGAIGVGDDSFHLAYRRVAGDFELVVELLSAVDDGAGARHGLMVRQDATASSRFSFLELREGSFRPVHGTQEPARSWQGRVDDVAEARFLKLVRRGSTICGFVSSDGETWQPMGADTWTDLDVETKLLVGFASTAGRSRALSVEFRVVRFGAIDPALDEPVSSDGDIRGELVRAYAFDGRDDGGSAWVTNLGEGTFHPLLVDGRLRLLDVEAEESSTSAFAQLPLEGIDDAIWQFDYDVHLDAARALEGGVVFTLMSGALTERVGRAGADLGYRGVGIDAIGGENVLTNSIAVELDLGELPGRRGDDAVLEPGTRHIAVDVQGSITPVAESRDELIGELIDDGGLHVRVFYNRGLVEVFVGGLDGEENLHRVLSVTALPLGFSTAESSAILGFTAGSSSAGFTVDLDDVEVRRIDCSDVDDVAIIEDVPDGQLAVGEIVNLDGSASHGGAGEESQEVFHHWEVIGGEAEILGPDHGPTVRLEATGEGVVTVRLTVDDLDCENAASLDVSFVVGGVGDGGFTRGDANHDTAFDISDAVFTLLYLFAGGAEPECEKSADSDDNGVIEITDVVFSLEHLFRAGRTPPAPYPGCGEDPTPDGLSCESALVCD